MEREQRFLNVDARYAEEVRLGDRVITPDDDVGFRRGHPRHFRTRTGQRKSADAVRRAPSRSQPVAGLVVPACAKSRNASGWRATTVAGGRPAWYRFRRGEEVPRSQKALPAAGWTLVRTTGDHE